MKIAVITGGSRGLGKNMALKLAEEGTDILLTFNSRRTDAMEVVAKIEKMGRKAHALQLDVGDAKSFSAFATQLKADLKKHWSTDHFDFLINNAGTGVYTPFIETSEEQLDQMYDIHLKGTYLLTQKLVPMMNDGGRIVNLSSGLARFSFPGYSAYAAMKGAIDVLSRYLAAELGGRKITVNAVAPGAIETDFGGGQVRDNKELNAMIASQAALGRVGVPDDIGGVVAFLCSEAGRWVNGQRLEVSGGFRL